MSCRIAIATLGCKVNQYESSAITGMFRDRNYRVVDFAEEADVYIINTCTVTGTGDRKSRQLIRRAVKKNPDALVVVAGCYSQRSPDEVLALPGVDLVIGTAGRSEIVEKVESLVKGRQINAVTPAASHRIYEELPAGAFTGRVRAFLKIQEGCENFCSYCIIPHVRGPLKSRSPEYVLQEAKSLVRAGYKEIVLTGINMGAYGKDLGLPGGLAGLLGLLGEGSGAGRIRISSVEPMYVSDELLDIMAGGGPFCAHIHIPLQSGDDSMLAAMGRRYTAAGFKALVKRARDRIADLAVTTDIIVGFPGETEGSFAQTYSLIEEIRPAALHVFQYSPRRGTAAANMPGRVRPQDSSARSRRMIELGRKLGAEFSLLYQGRVMEVLVEEEVEDRPLFMEGLTGNYLRVLFPGRGDQRGQLVKTAIRGYNGEALEGIIVEEK